MIDETIIEYIIIKHPITSMTICAAVNVNSAQVTSTSFGEIIPAGAKKSNNLFLIEWAQLILNFLDRKIKDLSTIEIYLNGLTNFQKDVYNTARKIPYGSYISYKELAIMSGYKNAIRAAASAMRNNPFPLIIPCHRVVGSNNTIGGFMGEKTGQNINLKLALLQNEGVTEFQ